MQQTNKQLLLGAHMSTAGGLEKAIERGESIECTAVQLFTKNNRQWMAKKISDEEAILFKATAKKSSVTHIIAHASYLINLCSPDIETQKKSVQAVIDELCRCDQLGIQYLVIHPGAYVTESEPWALKKIAHHIDHIYEAYSGNTQLLLETMAGQGTTVCRYFEQLAEVRELTSDKKRIGFCLDTCHIFSAGYDLRTTQTYDHTMHHFDKICGIQHLKAIHVNDSKKELGSCVDRHEEIGKGKLGLEAFALLINDERFFDIPKILETPNDELENYAHNMALLKNLFTEKTKKRLSIT
ncbi:deoxyribonuclease IV [Candidatus Dependentiae bacterium HGW-Dependentiae-1]|nr:MAG: deoxyribonuclease IV [Candidatus Dependentiae bacterium HGW-Dependentiae-1]